MIRNKLLLCLLVFAWGCASKAPIQEPAEQVPFKFQVLDEIYDGESLYIKVQLEQLSSVLPSPSILLLQGIHSGAVVEEKYHMLKDLNLDQNSQVVFSLPAQEISDYQLHLYWGEQAKNYFFSQYPKLRDKIELKKVRLTKQKDCQESNCLIKYILDALVVNHNEATLPVIILQFDLFDPETGTVYFSQDFPVNDLNLAPGLEKNIRFVIVEPEELRELQLRGNLNVI